MTDPIGHAGALGREGHGLTRRDFIQSTAVGVAAMAAGSYGDAAVIDPHSAVPSATPLNAPVTLKVNQSVHELTVEPRVTLLDALRDHLGLTGPKKGCDRGQCGACTVLVNGRRINACLTLAVMHGNDEIITVEGLATGGRLHPLQAAFIHHDAFQCGFCTPGQLCSAAGLLQEARASGGIDAATAAASQITDSEIREGMSGNLCRCGAYPNIVAAIREVGADAARHE